MVLQSEIIDFTTGKLIANTTFTTEYGVSSSVDYADNSLDTVVGTITDPFVSVLNNKIIIDTIVSSGLGNGSNVDAFLQKGDGLALNKSLIVSVAKTVDVVIDNRQQIIVLVE